MFAVVETGGKQYKVAPGDQLDVEYLGFEAGQQFDLGRVLMVGSDGGEVLVGSPIVDGARVLATVVAEHRGDKLIVFKYKPKKRYRRKNGHRQMLTRVSIDDILADGIADAKKQEAAPQQRAKKATAPVEVEAAAPTTEVEVAPAAEVETTPPPAAEAKPRKSKKVTAAAPAAETAPATAEAAAEQPAPPVVKLEGVPTSDTIGSGLDLQDALNTEVETEEGKA